MTDSLQDLSLPKSMIARLAKGVLPANTQIQKDALLALHKSATVFVSYIASKYVSISSPLQIFLQLLVLWADPNMPDVPELVNTQRNRRHNGIVVHSC